MKIVIREDEKYWIRNARNYIKGLEIAANQQTHSETGFILEAIKTIKRGLDVLEIFEDAPGTTFYK